MLEEFREDIHHCLKCGACRIAWPSGEPICPSGLKFGFDSHYALGRVEIARHVLEGSLALNAEVLDRVYTCTACGACDSLCLPAVGVGPLKIIEALKIEGVESGLIPPAIRDYLKGMLVHGNPYRQPQSERGRWSEGLELEPYQGQDYLFYVGCVGSYDDRGRRIARAWAVLLKALGISFGVLGREEGCDGHEVLRVGERGLFEKLARANIEKFQARGVKKIITFTPHALYAFEKEYPALGGVFEAEHAGRILARRSQADGFKLRPAVNADLAFEVNLAVRCVRQAKKEGRGSPDLKCGLVTYHDPCFLGRRLGEYESPRWILSDLLGLELREMENNRESALCCGGGGGNFFTDVLGGGSRSPARARVRQAMETGAETLVTACPNCARMLEDAVKAEGLEEALEVLDLAEIVLRNLALNQG
ncbi:MAG: (Fe-S)-binding protein [Thermodesulfobacteriota bacterium]